MAVCLAFLPVFGCFRFMELAEMGSRRVVPVSPPPLQGTFAVLVRSNYARITFSKKALSKLDKEGRRQATCMRIAMLLNRQAPGRDFHKHFSLAPARGDTKPPSHPQSAPAYPVPYKTGPKLAMRRRGHHTCHSCHTLSPPVPLSCAAPHPPVNTTCFKKRDGATYGGDGLRSNTSPAL